MRRDDEICKRVKCGWFDDLIHPNRCELRCDLVCSMVDFQEANDCKDCSYHDEVPYGCLFKTEHAVSQ